MDIAREVDGGLRSFQDSFADALLAPGDAIPPSPLLAALTRQPGFAVYRNTVLKGCIDALQANYPAVTRLVGEEWFRAAAAVYSRGRLPSHPSLLDHGRDFAAFLDAFEPARELPYLADVARLDRCWTEAHVAADATSVAAAAVARLTTDELAVAVLHPHPAARWAWFAGQPIMTIWSRNRSGAADVDDDGAAAPEIDWHGEGALITRPLGPVEWTELSAAGCAFLDACARGATVSAAAAAALAIDPRADLAQLMAVTLNAGTYAQLSFHHEPPEESNR
jgi:Putative DNA-binding domain